MNSEPIAILGIEVHPYSLQFNNSPVHFVATLNRRPQFVNDYYGDERKYIIGRDGIAYQNYTYWGENPYPPAFGGSRFEIPLSDGTVITTTGQWGNGNVFPDEPVVSCAYVVKGDQRRPYAICLSMKAVLDWMLRNHAVAKQEAA